MPGTGSPEYFLSLYMEAPDITALAVMRHDQCAALWRIDGNAVELVRYWEFERVTGFKHHRLSLRDPEKARAFIGHLLAEEGLTISDLRAIWGTPGLATERIDDFLDPSLCVHSVSHLLSAVLLDWDVFRSSTIMGFALDAGPDMNLEQRRREKIYVGCVSRAGKIDFFPIESPGLIWILARGMFGREEGTLMALASATTCTVEAEIEALVADLTFWNLDDALSSGDAVLRLAASAVDAELATPEGRCAAGYDDRFSVDDNRQSAVMKLVERASAAVVTRNVHRCIAEHAVEPSECLLALSGGFALNCPTNSRLMNEFSFQRLLAPPCVNDGGQALGIGLMGLQRLGLPSVGRFRFNHAYHGRESLDLADALDRYGPALDDAGTADEEQLIKDLIEAPIAWVEGRAEVGPRALGHRSLLADPRTTVSKDRLNEMKGRQWWRPVAPMILEDEVASWFEDGRPSPYMLEVFFCREDKRAQIPAALHLDGSARVQTVNSEQNDSVTSLISAFAAVTGVPIICNTSLNDKGEPLVDTASQALNFCARKGVRVAYIDGMRIVLRPDAVDVLDLETPERRFDTLYVNEAARWSEHWSNWESRGLDAINLHVWAWNPDLRRDVDPFTDRGAAVLRRLTTTYLRRMVPLERHWLRHFADVYGPDADPLRSAESENVIGARYQPFAPLD